jgi:hypothetical protein
MDFGVFPAGRRIPKFSVLFGCTLIAVNSVQDMKSSVNILIRTAYMVGVGVRCNDVFKDAVLNVPPYGIRNRTAVIEPAPVIAAVNQHLCVTGIHKYRQGFADCENTYGYDTGVRIGGRCDSGVWAAIGRGLRDRCGLIYTACKE